jgi:cell division protein FtsW
MSDPFRRTATNTRTTAPRNGSADGPRKPAPGSRGPGDRDYQTITATATSGRGVSAGGLGTDSVRNRVTRVAAHWDYPLLAILAILLAGGLVMVFSASIPQFGVDYFLRQVAWVAVGTLVLIVMAHLPYGLIERMAIPIMIVALVGLAAVLLFSDDRFGARRTFFGSIQPSEFAKLAVAIYVSAWVASKGRGLSDVRGGLIPFAILMGLIASLIVLEPNFSTAIVILVSGIAIFFVGGADVKQLLIVSFIGLLMFGLLLWKSPHAYGRIEAWVNMLSDPSMAPENVRRALELMRQPTGLVPDSATWLRKFSVAALWSDYLFANIGADLGLIGQLAVVVLFAALGYRCLGIALHAPDRFSGLAAIGITTWILTQAVIHIGTSLALIPATGQPLPFMSYGGSAMVASMAGIGLLLSIGHGPSGKKTTDANLTIGGRDRRARVSDPGRGERTTDSKRKPEDRRRSH